MFIFTIQTSMATAQFVIICELITLCLQILSLFFFVANKLLLGFQGFHLRFHTYSGQSIPIQCSTLITQRIGFCRMNYQTHLAFHTGIVNTNTQDAPMIWREITCSSVIIQRKQFHFWEKNPAEESKAFTYTSELPLGQDTQQQIG